ncbi:hypothetical protein GCM10010191_46070 [Actinomadura vinacea]|uniref:Uncharacterized protein n=1 Tax=Actinomadura vinacea TaxID=115336 RepID=A0ABP5WI44_9ACTN
MEHEAVIGRSRDSARPERGAETAQGESLLDFTIGSVNEGGTPYIGHRQVEVLLCLEYPRTEQAAELLFYVTGKTQELLFKLLFTEVN